MRSIKRDRYPERVTGPERKATTDEEEELRSTKSFEGVGRKSTDVIKNQHPARQILQRESRRT